MASVFYKILRYINLTMWIVKIRKGPPPGTFKRIYLRRLAKKYKLKVFVETGTYRGETINALKNSFDSLYSIELSTELYNKARAKFSRYPRIKIYNGDSKNILPQIVAQLKVPTLFWLDAHYSGGVTAFSENPIIDEITTIIQAKKEDVIVIDDLRLFGIEPDYPKYQDLKDYVKKIGNERFVVKAGPDCILIAPAKDKSISCK